MANELLIYGVGRSGTTAIYNTIQSMVLSVYSKVDFVYEPFLWSPDVFNMKASDITDEFSYTSSLSIDGIYANSRLPLLVSSDPGVLIDSLDDNIKSYLDNICIKKDSVDFLITKAIRANGRSVIFDYINPENKKVFVIRNPVDVLNSSLSMFCFYGSDFHRSDYQRFYQEAVSIYGKEAEICPTDSTVQQQAFYWYFSNRKFLEDNANKPNTFFIVYDDYINNKSDTLNKLAEFMCIHIPEEMLGETDKKVGPVTANSKLTADDVEQLKFYHEKYIELIELYFSDLRIDFESILLKHCDSLGKHKADRYFTGYTPLFLQNQLYRQHKKSCKRKISSFFRKN